MLSTLQTQEALPVPTIWPKSETPHFDCKETDDIQFVLGVPPTSEEPVPHNGATYSLADVKAGKLIRFCRLMLHTGISPDADDAI